MFNVRMNLYLSLFIKFSAYTIHFLYDDKTKSFYRNLLFMTEYHRRGRFFFGNVIKIIIWFGLKRKGDFFLWCDNVRECQGSLLYYNTKDCAWNVWKEDRFSYQVFFYFYNVKSFHMWWANKPILIHHIKEDFWPQPYVFRKVNHR